MSYIGNEPVISATRTVTEITATAGQTVFTANGGYTVGYIDVFVNGAQLQSADFTATDGSTVVLTQAAQVGDVVRLVAWGTFSSANITSGSLSAGGITWSQSGGVTLPRIDSSNEGGQLNFNRASDNTATWSIDSFGNTSTPSLRFIDGANVRAVINGSGDVGIGTSSPETKLHVTQSNDALPALQLRHGDGDFILMEEGGGTDLFKFTRVAATNDLQINNVTANNIRFATSNTERMRITSGGAVCIASTISAFQLRSAGVASAHFGDDYDGTVYGCVQITRTGDQPDNRFHLAFIRNGFQVAGMGFLDNSSTFAIQNSFNTGGAGVTLGVNATSWGTTSDERKKNIIAPVENALTKLADWRSVYYKYKTDEEDEPQRVGLIAQDVQATLPEAVSVEEDEIKTLQLRYTETIPLLVKAIQELKTIVDNQKIELDNAKAEIELLKGAN